MLQNIITPKTFSHLNTHTHIVTGYTSQRIINTYSVGLYIPKSKSTDLYLGKCFTYITGNNSFSKNAAIFFLLESC